MCWPWRDDALRPPGELNRLTLSERVALRGCQRLHPGAQNVPVRSRLSPASSDGGCAAAVPEKRRGFGVLPDPLGWGGRRDRESPAGRHRTCRPVARRYLGLSFPGGASVSTSSLRIGRLYAHNQRVARRSLVASDESQLRPVPLRLQDRALPLPRKILEGAGLQQRLVELATQDGPLEAQLLVRAVIFSGMGVSVRGWSRWQAGDGGGRWRRGLRPNTRASLVRMSNTTPLDHLRPPDPGSAVRL